jgi:sugar/nucleoside kinase (ribokinase family)
MKDVVGFGSLNVDYIYEAEDISFLDPFYPKGEMRREWVLTDPETIREITQILQTRARLISKAGGGSAANTIFCLAKMGFRCGFMGKVGRDADADFLLNEMSAVSSLDITRNASTGKALIVLGPHRDRIIMLLPNANRSLTRADINPNFIAAFSLLHLTSLLGEGLDLQEHLVTQAAGKIKISFDPGEVYAQKGLAALAGLLSRCDILFITEGELSLLTGLPLGKSIAMIRSLGTKVIVVKKKGAGAIVCHEGHTWSIPSERIQAKDTTGAGDVFAAGFLAGYLREIPLPDCGRLGLALAHQSMLGLGRAAYPDERDFERALRRLKTG